jgi:hypothetical protein
MAASLTTADRLDIQQLFARYAWALDTGDVEAFVRCFATAGELVWDAFDVPLHWSGADELRWFIEGLRSLPQSAGRQHHVSNVLIEPVAAGARARAFVLVTLREPDGSLRVHVAGWYEDELVNECDEWRIRRRTIRDWAGPVLERFAGQPADVARRPMPAALLGLLPPHRRHST